MVHDYAVFAAIGGVVSVTLVALSLGVGDGLVGQAITALTVLAGVKVALKKRDKDG